jgi:hypothetical protein
MGASTTRNVAPCIRLAISACRSVQRRRGWPRGASVSEGLVAAPIEESCSSSADFSPASSRVASIDVRPGARWCRCSSSPPRQSRSPFTATCHATACACTVCAGVAARDWKPARRCARNARGDVAGRRRATEDRQAPWRTAAEPSILLSAGVRRRPLQPEAPDATTCRMALASSHVDLNSVSARWRIETGVWVGVGVGVRAGRMES